MMAGGVGRNAQQSFKMEMQDQVLLLGIPLCEVEKVFPGLSSGLSRVQEGLPEASRLPELRGHRVEGSGWSRKMVTYGPRGA